MMTLTSWNDLKKHVYSPYSKSNEVCLVIDSNGKAHPGVRIENAAFPDTISAYQSAVYGCLVAGQTPVELVVDSDRRSDDWQCIYVMDVYGLRLNVQSKLAEIQLYPAFKSYDVVNIDSLKALLPLAKTMHSNFPVAALLQTEYGFISGVNIENVDWRMGLCAERMCLARAISNGAKQLGEIHVFAPKADYCSPCGACRQVMNEHIPQQRVHLYHGDETHSEIIMNFLLPHSFTSSSLNK